MLCDMCFLAAPAMQLFTRRMPCVLITSTKSGVYGAVSLLCVRDLLQVMALQTQWRKFAKLYTLELHVKAQVLNMVWSSMCTLKYIFPVPV